MNDPRLLFPFDCFQILFPSRSRSDNNSKASRRQVPNERQIIQPTMPSRFALFLEETPLAWLDAYGRFRYLTWIKRDVRFPAS